MLLAALIAATPSLGDCYQLEPASRTMTLHGLQALASSQVGKDKPHSSALSLHEMSTDWLK